MRVKRPAGIKETDFLCLLDSRGLNRPPLKDGKRPQAPGVLTF